MLHLERQKLHIAEVDRELVQASERDRDRVSVSGRTLGGAVDITTRYAMSGSASNALRNVSEAVSAHCKLSKNKQSRCPSRSEKDGTNLRKTMFRRSELFGRWELLYVRPRPRR